MAAKQRLWVAGFYEPPSSEAFMWGSLVDPTDESELTGTHHWLRDITLAADEKKVVYDYTTDGHFDRLILECPGTGYVHAAAYVDEPTATDGTDWSASGNSPHWMHLMDISCRVPHIISTDQGLVIAAAATLTGDSSGLPGLWSNASRKTSKVYKVAVWNPDASNTKVLSVRGLN